MANTLPLLARGDGLDRDHRRAAVRTCVRTPAAWTRTRALPIMRRLPSVASRAVIPLGDGGFGRWRGFTARRAD